MLSPHKFTRHLIFLAILSSILVLTGCNNASDTLEPGKINAISPRTHLGKINSVLTNAVHIKVVSQPLPGLLGGKGKSKLMEGIRLIARPSNVNSGLSVEPQEGVTSAGGDFMFSVRLGDQLGDQYLDIFCADYPEIKLQMRFVAGVTVANNYQEIIAGDVADKPFCIKLSDADGAPLPDIPVFFELTTQPGKSGTLSKSRVLTNDKGIAEVSLKTSHHATGKYRVRVEVADPDKAFYTRPFFCEAVAISPASIVLVVLSGLAIFLFGVNLMSDGLQQLAGNKMRTALAYITRNRVTGILAGTVLTALVQSSSLITVMTVGFVNAGLLTLRQAIGVVLGANIGTTVTAQIISFRLSGLSHPAMIIGVLLLIIGRKSGTMQGIARSVLGFGFLFLGMTQMSTELASVADFPTFASFFRSFDCMPVPGGPLSLKAILGAVGIGTALTVMVQNSATTIGLAIALANSGLLNIWTTVPIVLGDNIGTTITALLASLNANRTARQTALAHSMFNIIGATVVVSSFYIQIDGTPCFLYFVDKITAGNVFAGENVGRHVAATHSIFNIMNVIIMTPFIGILAWICEHILPGKKITPHSVRLEKNLLNTPPLALFCAMRALGDMTETAWDAASKALRSYKKGEASDLDGIQEIEDSVDAMQHAIMDYIVELTRKDLTANQAAAIPVLMHCVNDAERISDLALLIAKRAVSQSAVACSLSEAARDELDTLLEKATVIAELTNESLQDGRLLAKAVEVVVNDMKKLTNASVQNHVDRIQQGVCTPERALLYVEVISALDNIVRHLENIAQRSDALTIAAS